MDAERRIDLDIARERTEEDLKREAEIAKQKSEYLKERLAYKEQTQPDALFDATIDGYQVRPEVWPRILVQVSGMIRVATWKSWLGVYTYGYRNSEHIGVPAIRFWYPLPEPVEKESVEK